MAGTFPDFNQVMLLGNLTADPISKETTNGNMKVNLTLAMNKPMKHDEPTQFINLVVFDSPRNGNLATWALANLHKGSRVIVSGKMMADSFIKQGEEKKTYYTSILVDSFSFVGGAKPAQDEEAPVHNAAPSKTANRPAPANGRPQAVAAYLDEAAEEDLFSPQIPKR